MLTDVIDRDDLANLPIGQAYRGTLLEGGLVARRVADGEAGLLAVDAVVPILVGEAVHASAVGAFARSLRRWLGFRLGIGLRLWLRLRRRCRRARGAGADQGADGTRRTDLGTVERATLEVHADVAAYREDLADLAHLAVGKTHLHARLERIAGTCRGRNGHTGLTAPDAIEEIVAGETVDLAGEAYSRIRGGRRIRRWRRRWRSSARSRVGNGHGADGVRRTDLAAVEQRPVDIDAQVLTYDVDLADLAHLAIGEAHLHARLERLTGRRGVRHGDTGLAAPHAIEPIAAGEAVDLAGKAYRRFRGGRRSGGTRRGVGSDHGADLVRRTDLVAVEQGPVDIDAQVLAHDEDLGDLAHLAVGEADLHAWLEGITGRRGVRHGDAGLTTPDAIEPVAAGEAVDV